LSEQTETDSVSGELKVRENKKISSDSLQSAYDEDATYRIKGNKGQSGYELGITETCSKDNPFQIITDYTVEKNIKSDVDIIQERLPEIKENTGCTDLYVDGGFHSEEVVAAGKENKVDIHFTNLNGKEPYKKFPVNEYDIDEKTKVILGCPKEVSPNHAGVRKNQSVAHFPLEYCMQCELRSYCHDRPQKKNFVVRINLKTIHAAQQRELVKAEKKEKPVKVQA